MKKNPLREALPSIRIQQKKQKGSHTRQHHPTVQSGDRLLTHPLLRNSKTGAHRHNQKNEAMLRDTFETDEQQSTVKNEFI